jgi:O-antigen/teichoic acid export membrane protein
MRKALFSILKGDIARSGGIIFLTTLAANLILFLANLIIADQLGAVDFGFFKVISYLFTFLPILIDFGANYTMTKYISQFKSRSSEKIGYMVKWFLKLRVISYSVLIAFVLLFNEQVASVFLKDASLSYLVFPGVLLTAMSFFMIFQFIVLGFHKFKMFALSQFLTLVGSGVLGVLLSPFGIFYTLVGWSLGFLIGNVLNVRFFLREVVPQRTKKFDVMGVFKRFSLPSQLVWISYNLYTVIVPLLSAFFSQEAIGYFSFAFLFYFATMLIPTSISSVVFPKVSELNGFKRFKDASDILRKAFMLYLPVVLIGLLLVFSISDWLFATFFQNYLPSLLIFKILVSLGLIFGFNIIYTNYLQGLGRMKMFALLVLIQNALLFAVSYTLLGML